MATKKIDIQHNHVVVAAGELVPAGYIGLFAKADGLYEILPSGVNRRLYSEAQSGIIEDMPFEYRDIVSEHAIVYIPDVKASFNYSIVSAVFVCDIGTITGVAVNINGVAVTALSSVTVTTAITEIEATGNNVVKIGDKITITGTGITGSVTTLAGKIKITRS